MPDEPPISAVATTLSIIESMAQRGEPVGVSELAKLVGANKPRTYRHLRTLLSRSYVAQDPVTDKYFLTLKLFHIGQSIASSAEFLAEARRVMVELRELTGQTVTVGQVEESGVRILDILKHRSAIEITTPPGTLFDFHSSAQGKVALAFGRNDVWRKVKPGRIRKHTAKTGVDVDALKTAVAGIRRRGWAVAPEESLIGVNALAAPVFDADSKLAGTIAIVGSIQHLQPKPEAGMIEAVQNAAAKISERLGYRPVAKA